MRVLNVMGIRAEESPARRLALYLTYLCDPAYEWPQVCMETFGTFVGFALRDSTRSDTPRIPYGILL